MAHFAKVINLTVVDIHVLDNAVITNEEGVDEDALGQEFLSNLWGGDPTDYLRASYVGAIRGCYPGVGYSYDPVLDVFVPPAAPEPAP
jgi:hypothetical protein